MKKYLFIWFFSSCWFIFPQVDSLALFIEYVRGVYSCSDQSLDGNFYLEQLQSQYKTVAKFIEQKSFIGHEEIYLELVRLFDSVDRNQYPSARVVRTLRQKIKTFRGFLFEKYQDFYCRKLLNQGDFESFQALDLLCVILINSILTLNFISISNLEYFLDLLIVNPADYFLDSPGLFLAGLVILVGGWYTAAFYTNKNYEIEELRRFVNKNVPSAASGELDNAVWLLYRKWCLKKSKGSIDDYEKLVSNDRIYNHFKNNVRNVLKK